MKHAILILLIFLCTFLCGVDSCLPAQRPLRLLYSDGFDNYTFEQGWAVIRQDDTKLTLSERPGFLRIYTQQGTIGINDTARNLVLRGVMGDFEITTHLDFELAADAQFAGLAVRGNDGHGVIFGLTQATGERGTFKGLAVLADRESDQDVERAGALYAFSNVILKLDRMGDTFTASYSRTGDTFKTVGTVTAVLSEGVSVGVGAANGENCGDYCDLSTPADFDYFEIKVPIQ